MLVTGAYSPTDNQEGCISATPCQKDDQRQSHILAHGSRQLQRHEALYSLFLQEILEAVYGMDKFDKHLRGKPFPLLMDKRPLAEVGHKNTLSRFSAFKNEYKFIIHQESSAKLPAELRTTSQWAVNTFRPQMSNLHEQQLTDPDIMECLHFRQHKKWSANLNPQDIERLRQLNKVLFADQNDTLWVQCGEHTALFIPASLQPMIIC